MVGGKREEVPVATITSSNIFAALEKKKKSKKPKDGATKKDGKKAKGDAAPSVDVWQAAPIQVASWADCEDDDDFGGLGPVPQWGNDTATVAQEDKQAAEEESDEEIEALQHGEDDHDDERDGDEGTAADADDDADEQGEGAGEAGAPREAATAVVAVPREPERQLSKKELKKKEMEDLEKVLAELGIQAKANGVAPELRPVAEDKEDAAREEEEDDGARGEAGLPRTKSKKSKKKKDRSEVAEEGAEATAANGESKGDEPSDDVEAADEGPLLDPKEALKRLKSQKSTKKSDSVAARAKAAIEEAAKRKAKLAKAKSKDKSHYNQQPVR
ncbi:hypothetical protein KFL_003420170 [Klebsormidium nitens]|uniref:Uncharacterized protein n=1 Tax=Klebsormidium nitens TaxID=105231 RepID=A0A1Y1IGL1_KLENI|nr:hypothetical protein KFL_003420170 [Klebsormidium nitens]|eukprot:GAQ87278.1 hypothetical protein KFL_003420170 [Klebsormidium nitens]